MARDCYKRQQGTKPIALKQNITTVDSPEPLNPLLKPALIQFQQYPTYVKRKMKEGYTREESDKNTSSSTTDEKKEETRKEPSDSTWGEHKKEEYIPSTEWSDTTELTSHNSPNRNPHRSGTCQYCDTGVGSSKMHGPLTRHTCRQYLKEDEAHDREQKQYEDKRQNARQNKYKVQLEGKVEDPHITQPLETTNTDVMLPQVPPIVLAQSSPTSPRSASQNFTRVTLAQVFMICLQDKQVFKIERKDGQVLTPCSQPIPLHSNRFACLPEIQDPSPFLRWTVNTLLFHVPKTKTGNEEKTVRTRQPCYHPQNHTGYPIVIQHRVSLLGNGFQSSC
jgi:hypothetical protein